ncbi:VWFA and cache domain-containing protein 1-like [Asterias rubens]|uniref:VWFA and cache domain-containing protein 1-like n=1 Tax=Asterias rubens TaxID=7604 RepID=UPI001455A9DF|nr:VWFA and cache domain-containing protein 1-like [Asterias rubens]
MASTSCEFFIVLLCGSVMFIKAVSPSLGSAETIQSEASEPNTGTNKQRGSDKNLQKSQINFNNPDLLRELASSLHQPGGAASKVQSRANDADTNLDATLLRQVKVLNRRFRFIVDSELGLTSLQEAYDSLTYEDKQPNAQHQLDQLTANVKSKLKKFVQLLNFDRAVVENLYRIHRSDPITASQSCCKLRHDLFKYDSVFQANITKETACERVSPVTSSNTFNPVKNISQVFKRHQMANPTLKWQYFNSEDGVHIIFPATSYTGTHAHARRCNKDMDMRNEPIYSSTVRPQAKHIVILIDRGSSVSEASLQIAKDAAEVALASLSEKDQVGILSVGSTVQTCLQDGCYDNHLATATLDTKKQLIQYIKTIRRDTGVTNHTLGLQKAFDLLQKSTVPQNINNSITDCVIVYISAGHISENEDARAIINTVINNNRLFNNRAIVMTYALVQEGITGLEELAFLRDLAELDNGTSYQETYRGNLPPKQKGVMTVLNQMSNLPSTVGRFYTILPLDTSSKPVFSLPHLDTTGGGLILTVSQTCYLNSRLLGIVGLEVNMADLLEDITYFKEGDRSYAFITDMAGFTIMHPSLARPIMASEPPLYADISHFEQSVNFNKVRQSMISGESGTMILQRSANDSTVVHYTWEPVGNAPLSVCVVIMEQDFHLKHLKKMNVPSGRMLLYHRLDLLPSDSMCMHLKQLATTDASTLMLAPSSFSSPFEHLSQSETKLVVQAYMAYLTDNTNLIANPGFKSSIKDDVSAISGLESIWLSQIDKSSLNDYVVRRYLATTSGILRMYPGSRVDKRFDPSKRPWYKRALAHPGRVTISSPYLDMGGAGYIITLSHVVFQGRSSGLHEESDHVVGIMGIDFTIRYFYKVLLEVMPVCKESTVRCFVMDDRGYLIAHPRLVEPVGRGPVEQQHITHQEILVSNDILYHTHLVKKLRCNNYEDRTIQRYYSFNTSLVGVLSNLYHGEYCSKYRIVHVPGTNTFVGVVNDTCSEVTTFCPCSMYDRLCLNCNRMEQTECECPCECELQLDNCHGTLRQGEDRNPSCSDKEENSTLPSVGESITDGLLQCYRYNCKQRKTFSECFGVVDCEWCVATTTSQGKLRKLSNPYCATQRECFGGAVGAKSPYYDEIATDSQTVPFEAHKGAQVGPVAGAFMGVIMALALVIYAYRHHVHNNAQRRREMAQNGSDASVRMSQGDGEAEPEEEEEPENPPPAPGAFGHANILLAALNQPSPYHQRARYGIRVWRHRPGGTPSESDHGYSTMTPHEDSEYQYVEPEPILVHVEPDRHNVEQPPGTLRVKRPKLTAPTATLLDLSHPISRDMSDVPPRLDPPPQTVLPSRRSIIKAQVHAMDTMC